MTDHKKSTLCWPPRWVHVLAWVVILLAASLFLRAVEPILLPFVLGLLVAYVTDPLVRRLERRGLSRGAATVVMTVSLFGLLGGLMVWLVPMLYAQLMELLARAPQLIQTLEQSLREHATMLRTMSGSKTPIPSGTDAVMGKVFAALGTVVEGVFASGAAVMNLLALLLITPIVCFYLIRDWPVMVRNIDDLLPRVYAPTIREQMGLINQTLAGYLRGQVMVMLLLAVYYIVAFAVMGLNYWLVLALLAAFLVIIPYIGTLVSIGLGLVVAHGQFGFEGMFWVVAVVYWVGQMLESQLLTPKIIGDQVGLHPLWMLFGMLAGAVLLGFVGVLLAVPLTAVIGVLVKFAVARYQASALYRDAL